ncbi:YihY/virulence factor BrkB family protein [Ramlibacter sp.]|uniref:YihY/virulence factor BrkB family protein n=1 Tax=Ramlibacter sp. TaxID=1917967 RepID=UPI002CDB751F|nr:YihY/virulence factor BrkB family protein [Ramlibacter sp.]HWI82159.1 YihY/virulence factor BrkB family protein [Ramlibacter sp.]
MRSWSVPIPAWLRHAARPFAPFERAMRLWSEVEGARMSAAISFYGMLSLAPLLLLLVGLLGWWVDRALLERGLITQVGAIVGEQGSALIRHALDSAKAPAEGLIASAAGFVVLVSGATGVFGELQSAFERLWLSGTGRAPHQHWWHGVSLRLRGIAYVLAFGFLLLVSLLISTFLNIAAGWAGRWFALEQGVRVLSEVIAFAICAALFYGFMRLSSGPKPRTRSLWFGAVVGATLFTAGRQVLAAYLSGAAVVSAYGAAGSLVVLLMWIYFSAAVLLFGAGCAKAVEETRLRHEHEGCPPRAAPGPGLRRWRERHQ